MASKDYIPLECIRIKSQLQWPRKRPFWILTKLIAHQVWLFNYRHSTPLCFFLLFFFSPFTCKIKSDIISEAVYVFVTRSLHPTIRYVLKGNFLCTCADILIPCILSHHIISILDMLAFVRPHWAVISFVNFFLFFLFILHLLPSTYYVRIQPPLQGWWMLKRWNLLIAHVDMHSQYMAFISFALYKFVCVCVFVLRIHNRHIVA